MSDNIDGNMFPVIYGYGHVERKHCIFDDTVDTEEPCEICLECNHSKSSQKPPILIARKSSRMMHFGAPFFCRRLFAPCSRDEVADLSAIIDLALEDYTSNEVLDHCPACNAVRWYILVPNEVYQEVSMFPGDESSTGSPMVSDQMSSTTQSATPSSNTPNTEAGQHHEPSSPQQLQHQPASGTISAILEYSNDLTLISGYFARAADRPRGFHLACRYLDRLLEPVLGCIPDIDGYELAPPPGQPDDPAGRQLMVHARVVNDFTNLPAHTTFHPRYDGPAREPCVTELVLPGAYENLEPVVVAPAPAAVKPKGAVGHGRNESEDSAIGLVAQFNPVARFNPAQLEESMLMDVDLELEWELEDMEKDMEKVMIADVEMHVDMDMME